MFGLVHLQEVVVELSGLIGWFAGFRNREKEVGREPIYIFERWKVTPAIIAIFLLFFSFKSCFRKVHIEVKP